MRTSHDSALANAPLAAPLLYLSSEAAGWEGLSAQAFHEPPELAGLIAAPSRDVSLILFKGGAMRLAHRQVQGSWIERSFRQGDLMLRSGNGSRYELRWSSLSSFPTQTLHLRLSADGIARTAAELGGCDPERVSLRGRTGFQDVLLAQIGFTLWRELEQPNPAGKLYAQGAAQIIAAHLLRHYSASALSISEIAGKLNRQQLSRVADFVHAHLGQDLSIDALAQQAGFSPYHFTRLFRASTGESPHQFVLRQRIEQAERLLARPGMALADVALACGFASQSHFSQAFKRQTGATPRAYRQARSIGAGFEHNRTNLED